MVCINPAWLGVFLFGLMISVEVVGAYVIYRYTDVLESYLPNCKVVKDYKKVFSSYGFWGKSVRVGAISMLLIVPKLYALRGLVDLDEVKCFPIKWRRLLVGLNLLLFVLLGAMVMFPDWVLFYKSHCSIV